MRYSSVVERALRLLGFGVPGLMMVSAWVLMGEAWPCSSRLTEEQKQKDRTATWCTVEKYCSLFSVTLLWEEKRTHLHAKHQCALILWFTGHDSFVFKQ